jgi:hypothetical protein
MSAPVYQSGANPEEIRAWVSRKLLVEDARWAMDVSLSVIDVDQFRGYVPLVVGHHFVRIAYEGAIAARSANARVGRPELAVLLRDNFAKLTARIRHLAKLLDNRSKSYREVLSDLASELEIHHENLTGNSIPMARWPEKDLGLFYLEGAIIGATIPISYRLGLHPAPSASISNPELRSAAEEWGGSLAVLSAMTLDPRAPVPTLDLSTIEISYRDRLASKYLPTRFEQQFPQEVALLLLLLEGDLNTSRLLLPRMSSGHEGPVFRAQLITIYHCLRALRQICAGFSALDTPSLRNLRSLLVDESVVRLLSPQGTKIRNRSVHYEMSDPTIILDLSKPMYGLVEAVFPDRTWETLNADVLEVTSRAAQLLADWKS